MNTFHVSWNSWSLRQMCLSATLGKLNVCVQELIFLFPGEKINCRLKSQSFKMMDYKMLSFCEKSERLLQRKMSKLIRADKVLIIWLKGNDKVTLEIISRSNVLTFTATICWFQNAQNMFQRHSTAVKSEESTL